MAFRTVKSGVIGGVVSPSGQRPLSSGRLRKTRQPRAVSVQRKTPEYRRVLRQPRLTIPKPTKGGAKAEPKENIVIRVAIATGLRRTNQRLTMDSRVILLNPTVVPANTTAKIRRKCQKLPASENRTSPTLATIPPKMTNPRDPNWSATQPVHQEARHRTREPGQDKNAGDGSNTHVEFVEHRHYEKGQA